VPFESARRPVTDDAWAELVSRLRDTTNRDGMVEAAEELYDRAERNDLPRLMDLLNEQTAFVREAAAWPISELAGAEALPQLLRAYQLGEAEGDDNDGFSTA